MTDATNSYDDWARTWLESQQQAWQAWLGGETATAPGTDPTAALAAWLGEEGAALGAEVGARLVAQGQQFLQLAESLGESLAAQAQSGTETDWQAVFDDTFARVRATLAPDAAGEAHPMGALGGLFQEWQKVAAQIGLPATSAGTAEAGPAAMAYVVAQQAYAGRLADIQRDALERLQRELSDQHASGGAITSLRALYDLWVDASEAAYAEQAATPAFVRAQSDLAHALCRLQPSTRSTLDAASRMATARSPAPVKDRDGDD
ncbi:MAG: hypothetical protein DRR03_03910 [Gammaproteobacteria bacterium]|nr:MAG: hypothetical protein DRR03_03910 [Gammaproteobacteria bacterium]